MFYSGYESGQNGTTLALLEIAQDAALQETLRDEVRSCVGESGWTLEAMNGMKYLNQCVLEGLRKYPPIAFLDRVGTEDWKDPGTRVLIKKGEPVFVSLGGMNTDRRYFEDPERFDPHRFDEGRDVEAFHFGCGPRACPGSQLGLLQMKVVIARILSEYELLPRSEVSGRLALDTRGTLTMIAGGAGSTVELKRLEDPN